MFLTPESYLLAYSGCCKSSLWPLLHSMVDKTLFQEDHWQEYMAVNQTFALATMVAVRAALQEEPDRTPVVWVHDYHLMAVPNIVRRLAVKEDLPCKIGFFCHVPFPPWDVVKIHPWRDILLQGMLGSDLVAFQSSDYLLNFLDCCERGLGTRVDRAQGLVEQGAAPRAMAAGAGRGVKVRALPMGVPFHLFSELAASAPPATWLAPEGAQVREGKGS